MLPERRRRGVGLRPLLNPKAGRSCSYGAAQALGKPAGESRLWRHAPAGCKGLG